MRVDELGIPHARVVEPDVHRDLRGEFTEWFRADVLAEASGRRADIVQGNLSTSARGTVRGLHFADVPPGQAKYVTVVAGAVTDVLVDLREGSPAFGRVEHVELEAASHRAVFVPEGVGHLFVVTSESATVCYLTTDVYRPASEHSITPLDPVLALPLPPAEERILSDRDRAAPTLAEARDAGLLPSWEACLERYAALDDQNGRIQ
jgi:dTDP-4-dehydrorhamnose 3,5-epimerase